MLLFVATDTSLCDGTWTRLISWILIHALVWNVSAAIACTWSNMVFCNFPYCCIAAPWFFTLFWSLDAINRLMQLIGNDDYWYLLSKLIKIVQACFWIPFWLLCLIQKIISVPISYTCISISACRDPFWTPKWRE